jgi:HK97 family phage prohead protease
MRKEPSSAAEVVANWLKNEIPSIVPNKIFFDCKDINYFLIFFKKVLDENNTSFFLTQVTINTKMQDINKKNGYAVIAGYASTFNNIDKSSHVILPTVFTQQNLTQNIPILFQHNVNHHLGNLLNAIVDSNGLYIEAAMFLDTKLQQSVFNLIKNNTVKGFSVGLQIENAKREMGILKIKGAKLLEVSLTANPVNTNCSIDFCEKFLM